MWKEIKCILATLDLKITRIGYRIHDYIRYYTLKPINNLQEKIYYNAKEVSYMKFILQLLGFGISVAILFILGFLTGWVMAGGQLWVTP